MKKLLLPVLVTGIFFSMLSCSKEITERNLEYPALDPVNPDANAGTRKPILLTAANEFSCATPIATTSAIMLFS